MTAHASSSSRSAGGIELTSTTALSHSHTVAFDDDDDKEVSEVVAAFEAAVNRGLDEPVEDLDDPVAMGTATGSSGTVGPNGSTRVTGTRQRPMSPDMFDPAQLKKLKKHFGIDEEELAVRFQLRKGRNADLRVPVMSRCPSITPLV